MRRAFTVVELLVVLAITAILAGLLLSAIAYAGKAAKPKKTATILNTLDTAFAQFTSDKGGAAIRPAPHPALTLVGNQGVDLCADKRWPMFFGWPVRSCGVIGSPQATVIAAMTAQQRIWFAVTDVNGDNAITAADGSAPLANRTFLGYILAFGGADTTLRDLKALDEPTQAGGAPEPGNIHAGTVWTGDGTANGDGHARWAAAPGRLKTGDWTDSGAKWKSYRLPGLTVYDAWGNEVVAVYDVARRDGGLRLVSAGKDGLLAIDPATGSAADSDNIAVGQAP